MKCPHCRDAFWYDPKRHEVGVDKDGQWVLEQCTCPSCHRVILRLIKYDLSSGQVRLGGVTEQVEAEIFLIRPKASLCPPCPFEVPQNIAEDCTEACLVLADSPKASAALSRRCLQNLLREKAGVKHGNLADEIEQVLKSSSLPSHLAKAIDAIRNMGNLGAHPTESKSSGEILPVETGEAEWNLDVLELLFDFYFIQPEATRKKTDALNKKLADAGKPPMKA